MNERETQTNSSHFIQKIQNVDLKFCLFSLWVPKTFSIDAVGVFVTLNIVCISLEVRFCVYSSKKSGFLSKIFVESSVQFLGVI